MSTDNSNLVERPRLTAWQLLKQAWHFINEHEVVTRASAIAFSGMMAAVPLLLLLVTICVQLLPDMSPARSGNGIGALTVEQLEEALKAMFPSEAYTVIEDQIGRIQAQPKVAVISISLAITMWCASSLFIAIIDALNHIYGVQETRAYWRLRLRAMGMVIIQMIGVTAALVGIIFWPTIAANMGLDQSSWWYSEGVRLGMAVSVVMFSFALCFHMGPDVRQRHRWVTPGSIVGTFLFLLACYGLKAYMQGFAHYDRTYGSLGGVMALLFWFYLSSLVLLLAAELNRIVDYAVRFGSDGHEVPKLGECVHRHGCTNSCHHAPGQCTDSPGAVTGTDSPSPEQNAPPPMLLLFLNCDNNPLSVKALPLDGEAAAFLMSKDGDAKSAKSAEPGKTGSDSDEKPGDNSQ